MRVPASTAVLAFYATASVFFPIAAAADEPPIVNGAVRSVLTEHGLDRLAETLSDASADQAVSMAAAALGQGIVPVEALPQWHLPRPALEAAPPAPVDENIAARLEALAPTAPAYWRLKAAYRAYRELSKPAAWAALDDRSEIKFNATDPRVAEVSKRLRLFSDLGAEEDASAFIAAVRRFQARHGLTVDGRVGKETIGALNVTPDERAQQISVNLEYWRLLPRDWPERYIAVNEAAATLELIEKDQPVYESRVIVGDQTHPSPVMAATLTAVTFDPPWDIPYSIAVREILPRLRADPDYLQQHEMFVVDRPLDPHGRQIDWARYSARHFPFRLRQSPGERNALGLIKFEMPNVHSVYLHDTPHRDLFARSRRTLSHGCIRVDCAATLAELLFGSSPGGELPDASASSVDRRTRTVPLPQPLPVYLVYFTAFVDGAGTVNFRPDVYGRDRVVIRYVGMKG